ncbi:Hypothetical protein CINCED_3A007010 [Cinara cedri]|uniref:Uncharacterized protein n=1 Tax=Cinara cedri TaxID=506608 RepID=A0A5E4MUJ0_9HEMI|nr:Hypothetical protein CINCED_3A007010 [Cinara cedri]
MEGGLLLRKICGQNECSKYQMCLEQEWECDPCSKYCEKLSDNYNYTICEQHCQDYIHDFIKQYVSENQLKDVYDLINTLKTILFSMIALNVLAFISLFVVLFVLWVYERKQTMKENRTENIQLESISTEQDPDNDIHVLHDEAAISEVTIIMENSPNVSEIDKEMEEFVEYNNLTVSSVVVHKSDSKPVLDPVID